MSLPVEHADLYRDEKGQLTARLVGVDSTVLRSSLDAYEAEEAKKAALAAAQIPSAASQPQQPPAQ